MEIVIETFYDSCVELSNEMLVAYVHKKILSKGDNSPIYSSLVKWSASVFVIIVLRNLLCCM
jgi:hypothetical protein